MMSVIQWSDRDRKEFMRQHRNATIEECARVASDLADANRNYGSALYYAEVAAAIRALKEKS